MAMTCYTDWKFIRAGNYGKAKGLLKYLTYREDRDKVRALLDREEDFIEIYVEAPLEVCEERDPKGLYKKARAGEIPEFTGISAPYEAPARPEIVVNTAEADVAACVDRIIDVLVERGYVPAE